MECGQARRAVRSGRRGAPGSVSRAGCLLRPAMFAGARACWKACPSSGSRNRLDLTAGTDVRACAMCPSVHGFPPPCPQAPPAFRAHRARLPGGLWRNNACAGGETCARQWQPAPARRCAAAAGSPACLPLGKACAHCGMRQRRSGWPATATEAPPWPPARCVQCVVLRRSIQLPGVRADRGRATDGAATHEVAATRALQLPAGLLRTTCAP